MEGATRPAFRFIPFGGKVVTEIVQDPDRARKLLAAAGYSGGENFPTIRLVINRNDTQQRIARAVARMWKQNLNINTDTVVKETTEIVDIRNRGDFDLIRRGIVFSTSDVQANLAAIYGQETEKNAQGRASTRPEFQPSSSNNNSIRSAGDLEAETSSRASEHDVSPTPTEAEALYEFPAIPLYFPTSYLLVKPYVQGFEPNALDVLSLREITIDSNWRPRRPNNES